MASLARGRHRKGGVTLEPAGVSDLQQAFEEPAPAKKARAKKDEAQPSLVEPAS